MMPQWKRSQRRRAFFGVICLLTFLSGASGMLTGFCALAASFDRAHRPMVGFEHGVNVLVLTHPARAGSRVQQMEHQHGWAARLLCVLERGDETKPDHTLELATSCLVESAAPLLKLAKAPSPASAALPASVMTAGPARSPLAPRPPHIADGLRVTRSTVLLI